MKKTISLIVLVLVLTSTNAQEKKLPPHKKGDPAPNFTFYDINQDTVTLKDFRGKYLFLDVWGVTCSPCLKAIPELNKIRKEFEGENIEFICVCWEILENIDRWEKRLELSNCEGKQYLLKDMEAYYNFRKEFRTYKIPAYIIIDPDGKFVELNAPKQHDELELYLKELLKK